MKDDKQQEREALADIRRAAEAEALTNNPLYIEAVTSMRAAMFSAFEDTKLEDPEYRHELWQRMQLMSQFQGKFESIVKQGKKAHQTLSFLKDNKNKGDML